MSSHSSVPITQPQHLQLPPSPWALITKPQAPVPGTQGHRALRSTHHDGLARGFWACLHVACSGGSGEKSSWCLIACGKVGALRRRWSAEVTRPCDGSCRSPWQPLGICQPTRDAVSSAGAFSLCFAIPGLPSSCSAQRLHFKLVECQAPYRVWWITKGRAGRETRMQ